jgi:hypothetical protein
MADKDVKPERPAKPDTTTAKRDAAAKPDTAAANSGATASDVGGWRRVFGRGGRQASPLRRWAVAAMILVACIGILVATVATWSHSVLFDTNKYIETVAAPIGKDPEAQQRLATAVSAKTMEATDFENRVREVLPPQAQFLAGPITVQVQQYLDGKVYELLQTETAYDAWIKINEIVHSQLVALLRNESNRFLVDGDTVRLSLVPLIARALGLVQEYMPDALASRVTIPDIDPEAPYDEQVAQLSAALGRTLPPDFGTVVIAEDTNIQQAQQAVRFFDRLVVALWVVSGLLIVLALVLSPWRLRTLLELALGTLVVTLIARVVVKRFEDNLLETINRQGERKVASEVVSSVLGSLGSFTSWLLIAAVILAVVAFLGGRPHWFKKAKDGAVTLADRGASLTSSQLPDAQRMAATYFDYLRGGGVVLAIIALFFATGSPTWVIAILVLLVAWEILVWWLAKRRPAEGGGAPA